MNDFLYKYFPPERSGLLGESGFFPNFEIAAVSPSMLNDPFECDLNLICDKKQYIEYLKTEKAYKDQLEFNRKIGLRTTKAEIKKILRASKKDALKDKDWARKQKDNFRKLYEEKGKPQMRILSLSQNYNSILMWGHYAKDHKGFIVGFEKDFLQNEEKDIKNKGWGLREVAYQQEMPSLPFEIDKNEVIFDIPYYTKSNEWSYEQEVRFVGLAKNTTKQYELISIDPSSIKSIYLGLQMDSKLKEQIINFCKEQNLSHVEIFQSIKVKDKYALDFEKISK